MQNNPAASWAAVVFASVVLAVVITNAPKVGVPLAVLVIIGMLLFSPWLGNK